MNLRRIALGLVPGLVAGALPVAAQVQRTGQGANQALPRNTAACIYETMPAEDREMALLLISREFAGGGRFGQSSRNLDTINELIEESHSRCLARFNWSVGRSQAATGYALTAILADALEQSLQSIGLSAAPLHAFYRENRHLLTGRDRLPAAQRDRLTAFVKAQGWADPKEPELALAALYVESLMLKDQAQRQFR